MSGPDLRGRGNGAQSSGGGAAGQLVSWTPRTPTQAQRDLRQRIERTRLLELEEGVREPVSPSACRGHH